MTTKALRFYESVGLLPEAARTPAGYRDYDERVLERLGFIRAAQSAGLTLAQILEIIAIRDQSGPPCQHVVDMLHAHATELDQRIAELSALREEVQRLQDRASTLDSAACRDGQVCHVIPS